MSLIDKSLKKLLFSIPTVQRLTLVTLLATLANVLTDLSWTGLLVNWLLFLIIDWGYLQTGRYGRIPPLQLTRWARSCYWLLLSALAFVLVALFHVTLSQAGLLVASHVQASLALICGLMVSLMAAGSLYLGQKH